MKKYSISKNGVVVTTSNSLTIAWNRLEPKQPVKARIKAYVMLNTFKSAGYEVTENSTTGFNPQSLAELVRKEVAKLNLPGRDVVLKNQELVIKIGEVKKTIKGTVHKNQSKLIKIATTTNVMGKRLIPYLYGPAGSGKTEGAAKLAEALDLPFYAQSFHPFSEPGDIFGYVDAMGEVVETPFKQAYTKGGVYLADEMDSASGRVLTAFNMALSQSSLLFPVSKGEAQTMLPKHKDFIFLAAGNTTLTGGNRTYSGRQELDGATIQRLTFLEWDYDTTFERSQSTDPKWLSICYQVRKNIKKHSLEKFVVSVRNIVDGDALLAAGFSYKEAVEMRITQGANDDVKKLLLDGVTL